MKIEVTKLTLIRGKYCLKSHESSSIRKSDALVFASKSYDLCFTFAALMKVKIINRSANALPAYETSGSAGMDLRANIESSVELKSLERTLIPTGLFIELPQGTEAQIRPRSGLSIKKGLTL